jgi:tetratricopeptide (TPR) repeat protein
MSFCPFCNTKIKVTSKFCTSCGKRIPASTKKRMPLDPAAFILFKKGANLQAEGKLEEAIECYDAALKINPNSKEILFSKQTALHLLEKDVRYIRKRIIEEKPESQQKLLKISSDIEEIIKSSLNEIPSFKEDLIIGKEDLD